MYGVQKITTAVLLFAITLLAGSSLCLATGQPQVMSDCGNQMNGTSHSAVCPFLSTSLPALYANFFGKEMSSIILLFVLSAILVTTDKNNSYHLLANARYRANPHIPPRSFLNTTTRLISEGTLHSRVFDF